MHMLLYMSFCAYMLTTLYTLFVQAALEDLEGASTTETAAPTEEAAKAS